MNRLFYTLLLYLATPVILLYLWSRALRSPDYRGRWLERFGKVPVGFRAGGIVLHSVSVGETKAAIPLIRALLDEYPDLPLTITTSTPTGSAEVCRAFGAQVQHCYLPIDTPGAVRRFLDHLQPKLTIIMETELWPNLLHQCKQRQIPSLLANARMSARSARGYQKKAAPLMAEMLTNLTQVMAQFQADGDRLTELGLPPKHLVIAGSIKFDLDLPDDLPQQQRSLRQAWAGNRPVWIAASTHPDEDQQLLGVHQQLLNQFPELLLILVPRHPERFDDIARISQQLPLRTLRRSDGVAPSADTQVVIGDTMGELLLLFGVADIAFIGGSLIPRGGHNPLEPAAIGLPILMGSHDFNFADISQQLRDHGAMTSVADQQQLTSELQTLLEDPSLGRHMGQQARTLMAANRGTVATMMDWIRAQLATPQ